MWMKIFHTYSNAPAELQVSPGSADLWGGKEKLVSRPGWAWHIMCPGPMNFDVEIDIPGNSAS